jgi:2-polyprenyl-3-methyl-5-hydroxy-6-metoxy-1,4-benzoquinol methylase
LEVVPEIVCPLDKLQLTRSDDVLTCPDGHSWEIRTNIPRIVSKQSDYADAFGLQWNTYRRTQLDSYTNTTISLDRARRCLGKDCWQRLQGPETVYILEIGCGAGRFTEVLLNTPAAHVTSIDYTSAVEANQGNFPQDERHRVIQADLNVLPFSPGQFDIVFCLGVVQHTPSPEHTIAKIYEQVKRGGHVVLDHYTYSLSRYTKSAVLVRPLLKRLPPASGLKWSERLVDVFFPLHRAAKNARIMQILISRISPILSYYHAFPELNDRLQYEWALLDTHDSLTDWYKHLRTKGQIERTMRNLGAADIQCDYGGNGVEARCRRPRD